MRNNVLTVLMGRILVFASLSLIPFFALGQDKSNARIDTVYVSSSQGNDHNPGTFEHPFRTVRKALSGRPAVALLRRGDIFYEHVDIDGSDLGAYGEGTLPEICGLKILGKGAWERGRIESGRWIKDRKGKIWRAYLAEAAAYYGGMAVGGTSVFNNMGHIVDCRKGEMLQCQKMRLPSQMFRNFDFWQGNLSQPDGSSLVAADFDYIYVYSQKNLNKMQLGLAVYENGVLAGNCQISNVKIAHWGRHGIAGKAGTRIDSCEIDGIGGSIQIGYKNWVCLGNGIEFYVKPIGTENASVTNCRVSRCYDAGLSVQGSSDQRLVAKNIVFSGNVVANCCQSFEFFLRGGTDDSIYDACEVSHNKSYSPGEDTGFRYESSRYKRCHILENSTLRPTRIVYRDNLFVNGNYFCSGKCSDGRYDSPVWIGNTCYILRGQDLMGNYIGKADVVKVPVSPGEYPSLELATEAAIAHYRSLTGDLTTRFIILDAPSQLPPQP